MAEWLRRLTRNQIPSGSVGSSPTDREMGIILLKVIIFCNWMLQMFLFCQNVITFPWYFKIFSFTFSLFTTYWLCLTHIEKYLTGVPGGTKILCGSCRINVCSTASKFWRDFYAGKVPFSSDSYFTFPTTFFNSPASSVGRAWDS